jgi:hypothetical protein
LINKGIINLKEKLGTFFEKQIKKKKIDGHVYYFLCIEYMLTNFELSWEMATADGW